MAKANKEKVFIKNVHMPYSFKQDLEKMAMQEYRDLNNLIVQILRKAIEDYKNKN